MRLILRIQGAAGLCFFLLPVVHAQAPGKGGIVVRVDDTSKPRCVDPSTDRVWLTLRRLVTTKKQGWFTKDTQVAVKIDAKVSTLGEPDKPRSFPLMAVAAFGDVPSGQVSVPIEYPIVSGLELTQDKNTYVNLGASITLINYKDPTKLGTALQALSKITSSNKLPIPASPYLTGATYLLQFANDTITNDTKKEIDSNNASVSGSIDLNFSPDGVCDSGGDFEATGTKAILYSQGINGAGYVDIAQTQKYCFSAELSPVFILRAALKKAASCEDSSYKDQMTNVTNDYIAFFLNKFTKRGGGVASVTTRDYSESISRCKANGVNDEKVCLAGLAN